MKLSKLIAVSLILSLSIPSIATQLLRDPNINGNMLAFTYAEDIWLTTLDGGEAKRLTSFQGQEFSPKISPDGNMIAFTGQYGGNNDVYVLSLRDNSIKRLTYHPGLDEVVDWTPDGREVLFRTSRSNAPRGWERLYTVSAYNVFGTPKPLPMNRALDGDYSDTRDQLVFRRSAYWERGWRNYRGGQNQALRIIDLNSLEERDLPFENDFDIDPEWHNDGIYFLSNRSQVTNVFRYDLRTEQVAQITDAGEFDVMSFAVDGDNLVYEYMGDFYLKRGSASPTKLNISAKTDFYWLREQFVDASKTITGFDFSPTGKRAVFAARGDIFTVPVEHGSARNLTDSSASREESPAWSPDGQSIAYFTDASGEYRLVIVDQTGNQQREIKLAERGYYSDLLWSPDNKRLIFSDQNQQLWIANAENGSTRIIDQNTATHPEPAHMASWSPDSKWVAYTKQNYSMFRELYVYSVDQRETFQLSDGMAELRYPTWDANGERIYFAASTNYGPNAAWLDMSTISFDPSYHLYYALLTNRTESPLLNRSDEEGTNKIESDEGENKEDTEQKLVVKIDTSGLLDRTFPLHSDEGHFTHLKAGKAGFLFYRARFSDAAGKTHTDLYRYSVEDRESKKVASNVQDYRISADGEAILIRSGASWKTFAASGESGAQDKVLNMDLKKRVDFAAEWQQIFREAWRFQRDYLYVDNFHGADWDAIYKAYKPLVNAISHPADLTYLLDALGAEVAIGHSYTRFGELPEIDDNRVGLLGADFEQGSLGFKFTKIYTGESFFPGQNMQAPLAKIAHLIPEGSYLFEVNGQRLHERNNLYQYFQGTLGKTTTIKVGKTYEEAQEFLVKPIASELSLRRNDWVESNRRYVDEKSGGKLAYVWVPDTADAGYTSFNRYFFSQTDKKGVIIDERFNHGGYIADYIISVLRRELNGFFNNPFNKAQPMTSPGAGIWGTQVMLINEVSGSGGDMLPYMFRYYNLGKLIGKRTWGGLVGIWGVPPLVDGGYITAPRSGFYNMDGQWEVENEGVAPDIDVEQWTKYTNQGIDPQLERAIEEGLKGLEKTEGLIKPQPEPPVRVPNK